VVRLIRSKGVGIYFVTQNPLDVPDKVLAQLGNRVQHALRAFTPRDQKAVRARRRRSGPTESRYATVISELGKGEALVSFLEGNGTPSMVERCMIRPPSARVGPVTPEERRAIVMTSPSRANMTSRSIPSRPTRCCSIACRRPARPRRRRPAASSHRRAVSGTGSAALAPRSGACFGNSRPRGQKLTVSQYVARDVTRSVVNRVAGKVAGDIGKSMAGSMGNTIGRANRAGNPGGLLRPVATTSGAVTSDLPS